MLLGFAISLGAMAQFPSQIATWTFDTGYDVTDGVYTPNENEWAEVGTQWFNAGAPKFVANSAVGNAADYVVTASTARYWSLCTGYNNQVFRVVNDTESNSITDYTDAAQHANYYELQFPTKGYTSIQMSLACTYGNNAEATLQSVISTDGGTTWKVGEVATTSSTWYTYTANTLSIPASNCENVIVRLIFGNEFSSNWNMDYITLTGIEFEGDVAPNIQERPVVDTDFTDWSVLDKNGGTQTITTSFSGEEIDFTLVGTSCSPTGQNTSKFGDLTGYLMADKSAGGTITTGTFDNITSVRYFHGATGSSRGWGLKKKSANDADWVTLSEAYANPASGVWVECEINEEDVQLQWYNLNDAQNAYMFELEIYSNVASTAQQVALTTAASPAEGGSLTVSPVSESYDEGTVLTLTATENFGYDFVNWTNADGEVVSTDAQFEYTIEADETLTANFEQVNTYELAMTIEGGGKDYMISYNPAPTIVGGKQMYEDGTTVQITASSNAILTFKEWNNAETTETISVTMDDDQSFTAVYEAEDYIVGWDFMKSGKQNRPADFASTADNEAATFYLINENGGKTGWLDKSNEAAGGYETFKGAAVNWNNLGEYWYQFEFNASDFTDIRVDAEIMYNFKAYTTIKVQYSTDGSTWKDAYTFAMTEVKTKYPISVELGEDADNAEKVYVRYYPDKTAGTDGAESANDGTVISNVFVYGTPAPKVLVINDTETECEDFNPELESYDKVVYNRELNNGYTYGFICLPFAPDEESLKNFRFYQLSSANNETVTFEEVDAPEAGRPYLYSIKEGATCTNSITGGTITFDLANPTAVENFSTGTWELVGSLKNETIDCTADQTKLNYVLNSANNTLQKVTKTLTVYPYTAYVRNNTVSSVVMMRVYISGPNGIKEISRDAIEGFESAEGQFDLQGRALSKPMKGQIYIQNGEKKIQW